MGRAFARCRIEATGPHVLRRSWATLAHRRGTGLKLIADILGHRSLETTAPYAQIHFEELRQAALPWPRTKLCLGKPSAPIRVNLRCRDP